MSDPRPLADLLASLPPEPDEADLLPAIQCAVAQGARPLVAVDDDPTGVQTVYDTIVLLDWDRADLAHAIAAPEPLFFVLTNTRSMPEAQASKLNRQLGADLVAAAEGRRFAVASRSDSTLRGHFPAEVLALCDGLALPVDGILVVPAFFEGGRYTVDDTHWVGVPDATSGQVVPASETPFARDAVFGFGTSHLPAWVEEKSRGRWRARDVLSVPLDVVRQSPDAVARRLATAENGIPVVVNAAGYGDMAAFVLGLLEAERQGKRFMYRTAASFVRVRAGLPAHPLLDATQLYAGSAAGAPEQSAEGGLVVVGSYVPASTQQVQNLFAAEDLSLQPIEVDVRRVLEGSVSPVELAAEVDTGLRGGKTPVLFTSRELVTVTGDENLTLGRRVIDTLIDTLVSMSIRPRFVVAKGGITSHEVARRGLGARRATVLGQLLPGVPVWRLESGPELRFPGIPYLVFPGNVGGSQALLDAVRRLSQHPA